MPRPMPLAAFEAYQSRRRFGALDGLRFVCVAAVLWHHGPGVALLKDHLLAGRGFLGVDFFFVLSGFLITTLLLREEQARGEGIRGSFSLRDFYHRRALRILPPYLALVGLVSLWFIGIKGQHALLPLLPAYLLFLANFLQADIPLLSPMWSLAVEEQFYLLWPLALRLLPRPWVLPALCAAVALNVLGIMGAFGAGGATIGPLVLHLPNATYAPILLGAGLAVVLHGQRGFALLFRFLGARWAAPCLMAGLVVLVEVLPPDLRGLPNLVLHLTMTAVLAAMVLREDNGLAGLLALRPVARIGAISYGIYLYHLIGLHIATVLMARLAPVAEAPWSLLVLYVAFSILLAEISFRPGANAKPEEVRS